MQTRTLLLLVSSIAALTACSSGSNTNNSSSDAAPAPVSISQVQGAGSTSPFDNSAVSVSGIVSGDFQDNDTNQANNLGGFYLQSLTPDADTATSEGIFVYDGSAPLVDVTAGDLVTVEGVVNEHFGETQISASRVTMTGRGSVQPIDVSLPADLERFEGMLVRLQQTMTVADLYELERFGTVQLYAGDRPYAYTNQNSADPTGFADHRRNFAARSILLDDGRRAENVSPIRFLTASAEANYSIRSGDVVTGVIGNLRFARGSGSSGNEGYRLVPTTSPMFETGLPRRAAPVAAGSLRAVGFNALNFFSSIDTGQDSCGPGKDRGCRGADSAEELERQLSKLTTTLHLINADIVGLMEIENNGGIALQMIVDRLNAVSTDGYDFVDTGIIGDDVITTAFIYKPARVSLRGEAVLLDSRFDMRFNELKNRPALAQAFTQTSDGATLSVVVNHLKSKGSDCDDVGDPDRNDGQGDCNRTRTEAAAALADWIATDPTDSGDPDYLIIGDLNAFVFEDPLTALKNAGFTNLLEAQIGGDTWSSVYRGESGALDHALANATLLAQVVAATDWHINADEPRVLNYNLDFGRDPSLFNASSPARSSDHDPIIVDLELNL
ncbi:MAG: ExeM/NucH family extracellular endonuclease [Woeseiaceae bacterium]